MRRREFIALVGGVATWPLSARAQQAEGTRRIGVLMARKADDPQGQKQFAAFRQGLLELGWSEGKTLHIETRWTVADAAEASEICARTDWIESRSYRRQRHPVFGRRA
jgi:putative ABC transport system substrate-binding protein